MRKEQSLLGGRESVTTSVCGVLCDVVHTSNQCPGRECDLHRGAELWEMARLLLVAVGMVYGKSG